jgi:uncharacterized protein YkwD
MHARWLVGPLACLAASISPAPAVAVERDAGRAMAQRINDVRWAHGLRPLRVSRTLERSAGAYARWMLRHDVFAHQPRIRVSARFSLRGENLAVHTGHRERVRGTVTMWMRSPPHRALILNPAYRFAGAGVAYGSLGHGEHTTWVLHVGG